MLRMRGIEWERKSGGNGAVEDDGHEGRSVVAKEKTVVAMVSIVPTRR
jgi:hypothetical protein